MFTGIVTDVGRIRSVRQTNRDRRYEIETGYDVSSIDLGASVSHAGCCLTVVEKGDGWFSVDAEGGSHRVRIRVPRPLHRVIAPKGSITVEGVSLTVNEVEDDVFGVNIIPHTWDVTTLGELKPGSRVNLEIDMLARYLARWNETA